MEGKSLLRRLWPAKKVVAVPPGYSSREPLMATVDSPRQAEELARLYGITLVKCGSRVATFYAEDPPEVLRRGKVNGWPELELNYEARGF